MDDRKLLELAAKAVGLVTYGDYDDNMWAHKAGQHPDEACRWNPMIDDGDAMRLAVTLRLWIHIDKYGGSARRPGDAWLGCEARKYGGIEAATRRAIVRVAAAMAKEQ